MAHTTGSERAGLSLIFYVIAALDSAGAISEAEAGDDGIEVLAEAVDEAVQGGQVVGLDALDPLGQMPALRLSRSLTNVG
ncbi:hypothetical protein [Streptomyces sp. NPDC005322]|uniref:hypothetical protein n=1 Tax=unclassified Streptomyces TaxID=2593676 RepID=UPI0033B40750